MSHCQDVTQFKRSIASRNFNGNLLYFPIAIVICWPSMRGRKNEDRFSRDGAQCMETDATTQDLAHLETSPDPID